MIGKTLFNFACVAYYFSSIIKAYQPAGLMKNLHLIFANMLETIEAMPASLDRAAAHGYAPALARHDWGFEFSDDHCKYSQGRLELARLRALQKRFDADGAIWNKHAPHGYRISSP